MTPPNEPSVREILEEFDTLVVEAQIAGFTKEAAEENVRSYQKEKYGNRSKELSSGITQ